MIEGPGGRGLPAAVDVAQQIGIDGGALGTRVWARLYFQWVTHPGRARGRSRLSGIVLLPAGSSP